MTIDSEREKWDAYYSALPDNVEDPETARFNAELVAAVSELLPQGGKTLEAGCGAGWQSLALARSGRFDAALMDFSKEALAYASRLFRREGLQPRVVEADLSHGGAPEFDLVFNAGVLEHYTLEEQAALIRSMKSRATQYVLVLVPNRRCYWYWLWRYHRSTRDEWQWGKEIPVTSMKEAFEAAGMRYLGERYFGASWTEAFLSEFFPDAPALREEILEIHRSPVIPEDQKCYLVGALGAVDAGRGAVAGWTDPGAPPPQTVATLTAALADALALRKAAGGLSGFVQVSDELARLAALYAELADRHRVEVAKRDEIIAYYQKQESELLRQLADRESIAAKAKRLLASRLKPRSGAE
jgi:SAM-dependent methyltransferase